MAVVRREVRVQLAQIQELINATEQMVRWNVIFQVEGVEQRRLPGFLTSHHRVDFRSIDGTSVNQHQMTNSTEFFNGIGQKRTFLMVVRNDDSYLGALEAQPSGRITPTSPACS